MAPNMATFPIGNSNTKNIKQTNNTKLLESNKVEKNEFGRDGNESKLFHSKSIRFEF